MRIALVAQEYPPETAKGGIASQTFAKAHGLVQLGHEVEVISRSLTKEKSYQESAGVKVTRIPGFENRMGVYTPLADWITYSAEVAAAIEVIHRKKALDLIDFPEWAAEGYVHLLNRTEWNYIPAVVQLHGPLVMFAHTMDWPEMDSDFYRVGTGMESICVRLADAVYSSSECSVGWCREYYGLTQENVPIIHTGVDAEHFKPGSEKASRPTIVFAGKLARNKGVLQLVEAGCELAKEYRDLHIRLLGRGDPQIIKEIKSLTARGGCNELVEIAGFVDAQDLPEHFARAHIFAAPSQYEGGPGFVYLEAMACGLPVIACSGSGAAEVISEGETGFLVPPQDVEHLTVALRELLSDRERREQMGEKARHYVLAKAERKSCIKNLEQFYSSVIKQSASKKPQIQK